MVSQDITLFDDTIKNNIAYAKLGATDEEILEAYSLLARTEGIFCEPASAASVAGLLKQASSGRDLSETAIVCVLTGNGLKDTELAVDVVSPNIREVSANYRDVARVVDDVRDL